MVSARGWAALAAFTRECLKVLGTEIRHAETVPEHQGSLRRRGFTPR